MSPQEKRASIGLAGIFGLRMLGMFLILPVFALYAEHLPGGDNKTLVGLALGAYGLTQAILQLPFGMASDRWGRKRVIVIGLIIFAVGSFIAAIAQDIWWVVVGRMIQGAGAISAAVTALLADLTREEHRTKAMAIIGSSIGVTFAASLVLGPPLNQFIGVPGIFALTGLLAFSAIWVVMRYVPDPAESTFHSEAEADPASLRDVLRNRELLRLDFGILALHAAQMAMFVVVPHALVEGGGLHADRHWYVYLPVLLASFVLMVPAIIYGEKRGRMKSVFVSNVALMLAAQAALAMALDSLWGIVLALAAYFVAFNVLEASLPSLISKIAPARAKGTAMGVYNTSQAFGLFLGGWLGGWLYEHFGAVEVFMFCGALMGVWLSMAAGMARPPFVRSRVFHVGVLDDDQASLLAGQLKRLAGVVEAAVIAKEGVAIVKVNMHGWDEAGVLQTIKGGV
jgi:predicted MFS family arabinose efflux permease